jgi:hypothetical protein
VSVIVLWSPARTSGSGPPDVLAWAVSAKDAAPFDRFQQRHRWLGFPLAVLQKYADDQGGYLAATITYYAFFAILALLLVLTTVLGFVRRCARSGESTGPAPSARLAWATRSAVAEPGRRRGASGRSFVSIAGARLRAAAGDRARR